MIFKLTPATKDYLWGGTSLRADYGKSADTKIIAETWELSCHKNGESRLPDGTTLASYLSQNPDAAGTACARFEQFPLLVKLIDAAKDLSVQVHPSDEYAIAHENQLGKTEMWYVLNAQENSFLYCGFKHSVTPQQYIDAIKNGSLCELLNKVSVQKNDMIFIEAGTIHAIGAGVVIAEIQQSSDVTYRVYDYNRKGADGKERELHVQKALEVTSLNKVKMQQDFGIHLAKCDYFTVDKLQLSGTTSIKADAKSFKAMLITGGDAIIANNGEQISAKVGDTVFATAQSGTIEIKGNGEALIIYVE